MARTALTSYRARAAREGIRGGRGRAVRSLVTRGAMPRASPVAWGVARVRSGRAARLRNCHLWTGLRSVFLRACKGHELGPGPSGGDAEQVFDMLFNGARRQMQPGRDLLVRDARGDQPEYVGLPVGDAQL
jgi:hypothetical protein